MEIKKDYLAQLIVYYNPLLTRYARRIIGYENLATHIVQRVLEHQYDIDELIPSHTQRKTLKEQTFLRCTRLKKAIDHLKVDNQ